MFLFRSGYKWGATLLGFFCVTLFRSRYSSTASQLWRVQNKNKSTVFENRTINNKGLFKRTKVKKGGGERRGVGGGGSSKRRTQSFFYQHRWYIYSSRPSAAQLPPHNKTLRSLMYARCTCSPVPDFLESARCSPAGRGFSVSGASVALFQCDAERRT